ncbi:sigma 54-interacting transcriptional regulator [Youngiibacter multivorans]|uniref:PAS domain S-box-containing protein n=1 Tax=Youngiibacter multivorans TaxID=937251 RepID=A0ABS4G3Q0_9CLOT|nr:sigma 54-interacting transcriptional regulator [Youngiibacter multivorans]MBP1918965.1 PAS domain S-box-containing protein [Youngiibacter multivorans]
MKDIVVLAPIEDIYDKAVNLVKERNYSNVEVILGNMGEGLMIARELVKNGVKIIVTRGGTYKLIQTDLSIPVVEIKVSAFDVLESFDRIGDKDEIVGVAGYTNVVYGFDILKKLIPNKVVKVEITSEGDIHSIIEGYKNKGIKTYIGDANIIRIAEGLSCKGIVIHSQKESILSAIQEARRILKATKDELFRAEQVSTMADFVRDGIVAIDSKELVTVFNRTAERIYGLPSRDVIGRKVDEVIPGTLLPYTMITGDIQTGELASVGDTRITCNRAPIIVNNEAAGAVATFQEIAELQSLEQKVRRSLDDNGFTARYHFSDIICQSRAMKECIEIAREYSKYDTPVHVCGESGVGKELFCQSMHNEGTRKNGPFVAVNCAAIPPSLIESEFFGYEEGSFTGARKKGKPGVFELAHNGTLFLDEISEIPLELQGRLLRVLQEKQVMRIGGGKLIPVDVKIITASNKYLKRMVDNEQFRKDLFFRINVLTLRLPPLSKRKEDIPVLAEHFIRKYAKVYGKKPLEINQKIKGILMNRSYEGNIRELENIVERSVILGSFDYLKDEVISPGSVKPEKGTVQSGDPILEIAMKGMDLKTLEERYIEKVLESSSGNLGEAAKILGINRTTLWRKIKNEEN